MTTKQYTVIAKEGRQWIDVAPAADLAAAMDGARAISGRPAAVKIEHLNRKGRVKDVTFIRL